jgi:pimeloyl-ACP methyl ester carboxylesterase
MNPPAMTTRPQLVLLPGLDGTGELFDPLLKVIPPSWPTRVISYPADRAMSYAELDEWLHGKLEGEQKLVLVAESFSGPLALRYAAAHPTRVHAIVLCASFIRPPAPRWLRGFAWPVLFRLPVPKFVVKRWMAGRDAPHSLGQSLKDAVRKVHPKVLAARVREVLRIESSDDLRRCQAPVLYLAASRDVLVNRKSRETIQAVRPDVEVSVVEAPHLVLQTAPEAAWGEIERFLQTCSIGGQS